MNKKTFCQHKLPVYDAAFTLAEFVDAFFEDKIDNIRAGWSIDNLSNFH